jgi:hypothetical protein
MNKVKELLAKKAEKEGKVEKGKEKEIAGRRKDAKKGESREDRTKRVSKKWRKAILNQIIRNRAIELNELKNFNFTDTKLPQKPGKVSFGTKRRPADIAAEKKLQDTRDREEEFVRLQNIFLQRRIGLNLYRNEMYFEALEYMERVCQTEIFYEESEEERKIKDMKRKEQERIAELAVQTMEKEKGKKKKGKKAEMERLREEDLAAEKKKNEENEKKKNILREK